MKEEIEAFFKDYSIDLAGNSCYCFEPNMMLFKVIDFTNPYTAGLAFIDYLRETSEYKPKDKKGILAGKEFYVIDGDLQIHMFRYQENHTLAGVEGNYMYAFRYFEAKLDVKSSQHLISKSFLFMGVSVSGFLVPIVVQYSLPDILGKSGQFLEIFGYLIMGFNAIGFILSTGFCGFGMIQFKNELPKQKAAHEEYLQKLISIPIPVGK
ncbi:MAG: hypothetical protein RLZZ156_478 [Deinococcota bacterium]|jgi:hypothetical protein